MKHISKVIINYNHETDSNLVTITNQIIEGCSDNLAFTFTKSELTNIIAFLAVFVDDLSKMPNGGVIQTQVKDAAGDKLKTGLHTICTEINAQKSGNTVALLSSGAPLTSRSLPKTSTSVGYPAPEGLKIEPITVPTAVDVSVKPASGINDHGTMFAFTPVLNAAEDINLWTMRYSSSHHLTVTGLVPATKYMMAAGFQGTTGTTIVWCKPILFGTAAA